MDSDFDETYEHRYLFTVRQTFGEEPHVDCFYKLRAPAGLTEEQAQIMKKLHKTWMQDEINEDTSSLSGMELRLRFNQDMYQWVCLVRTTCEITAEDLDLIIKQRQRDGKLKEFLDESALKI
jgi:hypothetical protein